MSNDAQRIVEALEKLLEETIERTSGSYFGPDCSAEAEIEGIERALSVARSISEGF